MEPQNPNSTPVRKPNWLRVKLPTGENYRAVRNVVDQYKLHTICESGRCPNMGECWGEGTATFMILGNICTRSCGFCNVATGRPLPVDWDEPDRVARSIQRMKIKHAVLTSVDRDDLPDGGSIIWGETVRAVRRLTRQVRIQAQYDRSLEVLRYLKANGVNRTKTGIMLGLGETEDELYQTLDDVRAVGVDVVTLGQYLQPSPRHLPVQRFVEPDEFERLGAYARTLGFRHVESSPLVRSSYHAERHVH